MMLIAGVQGLADGWSSARRISPSPIHAMDGRFNSRGQKPRARTSSSIDLVRSIPASRYSDFRNHLQTGDLLFGAGRYPFSRLIRMATGSPWSHVGLVIRDEQTDRMLLLESIETRGVRLGRLSDCFNSYRDGRPYDGHVVVARHTSVKPGSDAIHALVRHGLEMIGPAHGATARCAIAFRLLLAIGADLERRKALMSAELVDACFSHRNGGRFPAFRRTNPGFISPADIWADPRVLPMRRLLPDSEPSICQA